MRLDSYHPAISLIFFATVIICACAFDHPVFLGFGYGCAFVYAIMLRGLRGLRVNIILTILGLGLALSYAGFNHFGVTELGENLIGNKMTLESLVVGGVLGIKVATVGMWVECLLTIVSSDMVVYLLGRLWAPLGLFASIALRLFPRVGRKAQEANRAQGGIGRGVGQGGLLRRAKNGLRGASTTLTWALENLIVSSDSMGSRGFGTRRKGDPHRTAFSIYRFDGRDRTFVLILFACMAVVVAGALLDQTTILYDPVIVMNRVTPLSSVFYIAYGVFCLMPLGVQIVGEAHFRRLANAL